MARRNINNFRYANDTTLMAQHKEELKSLLMRVKEESEKADLKLNIKKTKIMASGHFMTNRRGKVEAVMDCLGSKITEDCGHEIKGAYSLKIKL